MAGSLGDVGGCFPSSRLVVGRSNSMFRLRMGPRRLTSGMVLIKSPKQMTLMTSRFSGGRFRIRDHRFGAVAKACGNGHVAIISANVNYSGVSVMVGRLSTLTGVSFRAHRRGRRLHSLRLMHVNAYKNLRPGAPINAFIYSRGSVNFSKLLGFCSKEGTIYSLTFRHTFLGRVK